MKMIRNKNAGVSAQPPFILCLVLMGAIRRTGATASDALSESISLRFGALRCPSNPARGLARLPGSTPPWRRDFASTDVCGLRLRPRFACMRGRAISRGAA
jgi:hypothetical protein